MIHNPCEVPLRAAESHCFRTCMEANFYTIQCPGKQISIHKFESHLILKLCSFLEKQFRCMSKKSCVETGISILWECPYSQHFPS